MARLKRACNALAKAQQKVSRIERQLARSEESRGIPIRLIKHEVAPKCGSYEVRFPDGRPSRYFYWDDIPGRRLRPYLIDGATAEREAKS